jgi:hypothetical protein
MLQCETILRGAGGAILLRGGLKMDEFLDPDLRDQVRLGLEPTAVSPLIFEDIER